MMNPRLIQMSRATQASAATSKISRSGDEGRFALPTAEGDKGAQASVVRPVGKHDLPDVESVSA